jgi:hypothetical protein
MKEYAKPVLTRHGDIAGLTLEKNFGGCPADPPPGKLCDFPEDAWSARSRT